MTLIRASTRNFGLLLGNDVADECMKCLDEFEFLQSLCKTNVVLIPKCESPSNMKDLRPISLYNVIYKILAKVLCNRLKNILPNLVDEVQSAFISNRAIHDNILIAF